MEWSLEGGGANHQTADESQRAGTAHQNCGQLITVAIVIVMRCAAALSLTGEDLRPLNDVNLCAQGEGEGQEVCLLILIGVVDLASSSTANTVNTRIQQMKQTQPSCLICYSATYSVPRQH